MKNKYEGLYIIGYGLSGGFGGASIFEVVQAGNQEEAEKLAFESACEEYEQYAGSNGLRDIDEIMQEDGIEDADEAECVYNEERESWLDYSAVPYSKEAEENVLGYHYHNPHKDLTDTL